MVISYSIKELNAIGEMVTIKECLSRVQSNNENNNSPFECLQSQLQQQFGHQIKLNRESCPNHGPLTSSVAEFFRKAQQNFYAQTSIDPTKVRRLSEVEAELIGRKSY